MVVRVDVCFMRSEYQPVESSKSLLVIFFHGSALVLGIVKLNHSKIHVNISLWNN